MFLGRILRKFFAVEEPADNPEFESGLITPEFVKILRVFVRNPDKSYSPEEIMKKTHLSPATVYPLLIKMAAQEWIRCAIVSQRQYRVYQLREDALGEAVTLLDQESINNKFRS